MKIRPIHFLELMVLRTETRTHGLGGGMVD